MKKPKPQARTIVYYDLWEVEEYLKENYGKFRGFEGGVVWDFMCNSGLSNDSYFIFPSDSAKYSTLEEVKYTAEILEKEFATAELTFWVCW